MREDHEVLRSVTAKQIPFFKLYFCTEQPAASRHKKIEFNNYKENKLSLLDTYYVPGTVIHSLRDV